MRFRLGLIVGAGAGYYLGTAAGKERHEQIKRTLKKISRSEVYETAADKAKEIVEVGVEKAKGLIDEHSPMNGHAPSDLVGSTDVPLRP
ncbi:MAG: hypothetical protein QOI47_2522 [Actinomycetota bacterium]|jgi:membrane protein DedA with SNARE-associated domain|nr:hypothetical protein [Actinomycetota bacterium]